MSSINELIKDLYSIVAQLEAQYPDRKFTLDGHLIGSIGEVIVSSMYDLTLLPTSTKTHDSVSSDGKYVQIKLTQRNTIALSSEPDYLIVMKIDSLGNVKEWYNGKGDQVWSSCGKMQNNGQRTISLSKLNSLNNMVGTTDRILLRKP